jgi:predicted DCC family thiol-disulfide oxidoreductase YuxK
MEWPKDKYVVLFDGVCNLCNSAVLFIIKRDSKDQFRFLSLQDERAQQLMKAHQINQESLDSIVLYIPNEKLLIKSQAILTITNEFKGFWKLLSIFKYIFPTSFNDIIYDWIAKNRYKWFGKKDSCLLPTQELTRKFL